MTDSATKSLPQSIRFLRKRDYELVRELGAGACGRTVLLHDDIIGEHFVCKKYHPYDESVREELFAGFLREIKLLHQLHHKNVVRVFNYYVYPDEFNGYILMEYIDGTDIRTHIEANPDQINQLFLQAVSGFRYMEEMGVLHRDIRPMNMMVTADGELKIIDLGFGKRVADSADFDKSISLNWWCETPKEFTSKHYDFRTEVYFVGKLFEKMVADNGIGNFQQMDLLRQMCRHDPFERIESFSDVSRTISSEKLTETDFSYTQINVYRMFAESISSAITKIEKGAKYNSDIDKIKRQLTDAHRSFMLEQTVPDTSAVTTCFVDGVYYFKRNAGVEVRVVKDFLELLQTCTAEQSRIVIANLQTRLDLIERYTQQSFDDPDVPF